jgi:SOS response regulatory protein OraA/RecX
MPDFDRVPKQSPSLKARALRLLSRREYSRHELAQKLLRLFSATVYAAWPMSYRELELIKI